MMPSLFQPRNIAAFFVYSDYSKRSVRIYIEFQNLNRN